jgi:glycosyltransferase involved in cell wall biosynthesis
MVLAAGDPMRIALVAGTTAGGTGAHVRMLAAGCAAGGAAVTVLGPEAVVGSWSAALPGVTITPVEFGSRPRPADAVAVLRLRRAFALADVVHAHGLRAGALSVLARAGLRGLARPGLVVTVHNAPPTGAVAVAAIYRALERIVARGADLVLCVSGDLERRMAANGTRRVGRAVVPAADPADPGAGPADPAAGRPVVLAVGRLAPQKGFGTLLEAAVSWRDMEPPPLVLIAGDGPLAANLHARAAALGVDAEFLGHRDDIPALLAAASVFVLPSRWEGQPLVLQEAMRAGAAIVATQVGGIPELVGRPDSAGSSDSAVSTAALLIPPGDPDALAAAVRAVLTGPDLAARLRAAARARAATLPTEAAAIEAALAAYAGCLDPSDRSS